MRLALYEPDIPQNTGTVLRLAACMGVGVDLIQGGVARAPGVSAPVAPLTVGGAAALGIGRTRDQKGEDEGQEASEQERLP